MHISVSCVLINCPVVEEVCIFYRLSGLGVCIQPLRCILPVALLRVVEIGDVRKSKDLIHMKRPRQVCPLESSLFHTEELLP